MLEDEWLDLVDESDSVVGRKLRSEIDRDQLRYYRVINLFIRNSEGELWIPRRTAHKRLAPLGLDFSCAGHVQSGDSYDETLRKEALEELNIDIAAFEVRVLGKTAPYQGINFFEMSYEIRSDDVPRYNPEDFFEYFWLTPEALLKRIDEGDLAKTTVAPLVRLYYLGAAK